MSKPIPDFHEMISHISKGTGANTRAIALAMLWAGERIGRAAERIARAVVDQRETHQVASMSRELGKAFVDSLIPPAPSRMPPPPIVPMEHRNTAQPKRKTTLPPRK